MVSFSPTDLVEAIRNFPWRYVPGILAWTFCILTALAYLFISIVATEPRKPLPKEKLFKTVDEEGNVTEPQALPEWLEECSDKWHKAQKAGKPFTVEDAVEPPEVFMSVVVPAFNEAKRITGMLEEAVDFLQNEYGNAATSTVRAGSEKETGLNMRQRLVNQDKPLNSISQNDSPPAGWEIVIVDDGSLDDTVLTAFEFARTHLLPARPRRQSGPWTHRADYSVNIPPGSIRLVSLARNHGKGAAVVHGMRYSRGKYVLFADADGASRFPDLSKLVSACQSIEDRKGRGVAVGSRAHLVGSEAVVKRSKLRNFLMHSFHLLLKWMTPPKTAQIRDTQCGFKLFSRLTLPYIVPYVHSESWIFDVELLMLAEMADIPVVEVPVGWREVVGSKLNVVWDAIGMAWGLAVLRLFWGTGIYSTRVPEETKFPVNPYRAR